MRSLDGTLRRYVALVSAAGAGAVVLLLARDGSSLPRHHLFAFWLLVGLEILGEFRPVRIVPRLRGGGATTSTTFGFAILLGWGTLPAVAAQAGASILADTAQRKQWFKVVFNAAQYALTTAAGGFVIEAFNGREPLITDATAGAGEVGVLLLAGAAYFVVNNVLTGVVVALAQSARVLPHIVAEVRTTGFTEPVLIALSPVFVIVTQSTPAVLPLLLVPVIGVYVSANLSLQKEHQALHDSLTGLPNRTLFRSTVTDALGLAKGERAAVLLIDLDGFKDVNDTLGHATGDRLLQDLGPLLVKQVREGDVVARLGGDEFAAYLQPVESEETAYEVARRIREAIAQPFVVDGVPLLVQASIGISLYPDDGDTVGTLLRRATS